MKKEAALKILRTNFYRKMWKKWLAYQLPFAISILAMYVFPQLFPSIPWPEISLPALPPSPLEIVDIIPPIFAGSLTAISVIIGFYSVSYHRFIQQCESWIYRTEERWLNLSEKYKELSMTIEQKLAHAHKSKSTSKETKREITEAESERDQLENERARMIELVELSIDAYCHLQEHSIGFSGDYLIISFLVLCAHIASFLATGASSIWIAGFVLLTLYLMSIIFGGLAAFLDETTFYHSHRELSGEKKHE